MAVKVVGVQDRGFQSVKYVGDVVDAEWTRPWLLYVVGGVWGVAIDVGSGVIVAIIDGFMIVWEVGLVVCILNINF